MLTPGASPSDAATPVASPARDVAAQPMDTPAAHAWRHLVLELHVPDEEGRAPAIQGRLDQIAAQGWELVALTPVATHTPAPGGMRALGARDSLLAVFKRPAQAS